MALKYFILDEDKHTSTEEIRAINRIKDICGIIRNHPETARLQGMYVLGYLVCAIDNGIITRDLYRVLDDETTMTIKESRKKKGSL